MLQNPSDDSVFLNSWDLSEDGHGEDQETGEKLFEIVQECIQILQEIYHTKLYAVVSDNAANMLKMPQICLLKI